jgi:hypothetical protein
MPKPKFESPGRMGNRSLKTARELLFLALLLAMPSVAQNGSPPVSKNGMQQPLGRQSSADDNIPPADPLWQEKQLRLLNAERQRALVADTNKLLKLAHELDAEISSANPDSLTPDQLHKIAEIEKLARSVKEKMSTPVRGAPVFQIEPPPMLR